MPDRKRIGRSPPAGQIDERAGDVRGSVREQPHDGLGDLLWLAAALHGKHAQMMKPADAERLTGYKVGGVSPFGQRKQVPTVIDETAQLFETVLINAGQRGLLLEITPEAALRASAAKWADVTA